MVTGNNLIGDSTEHYLDLSTRTISSLCPLHTHTLEILNCYDLARKHSELITQGRTSLEIAVWLGDKLNIPSWKEGKFHGERKVLSTPAGAEIERLKKFIQALGVPWKKANGGSDSHPHFLLIDGYTQNALFGSENMGKVDEKLKTIHMDWQKMGDDFASKERYLRKIIDFDVTKSWNSISGGFRLEDGSFRSGYGLSMSGSLHGNDVVWLCLTQSGSCFDFFSASGARLCLLA